MSMPVAQGHAAARLEHTQLMRWKEQRQAHRRTPAKRVERGRPLAAASGRPHSRACAISLASAPSKCGIWGGCTAPVQRIPFRPSTRRIWQPRRGVVATISPVMKSPAAHAVSQHWTLAIVGLEHHDRRVVSLSACLGSMHRLTLCLSLVAPQWWMSEISLLQHHFGRLQQRRQHQWHRHARPWHCRNQHRAAHPTQQDQWERNRKQRLQCARDGRVRTKQQSHAMSCRRHGDHHGHEGRVLADGRTYVCVCDWSL